MFSPSVGAQEAAGGVAATEVGGTEVTQILARLGAKLEHAVSADQLRMYSRQFGLTDHDGDGRHSTTEFIENGSYLTPQARRGIFKVADSNADGFVTSAEYTLNRIITDEAKAIVQAMDDDGDGVVQRAEFLAHAGRRLMDDALAGHVFAAWDSNDDGKLVVPEYLRVWGAWARMRGKTAEQRLAAVLKRHVDSARLAELDAYWAEVSRAVREGDFEGYKATCHSEGVLVSGSSMSSYPLAKALDRWQQGFMDTRAGKVKANVEFRFSQRLGDDTTAHETGIFRYSTVDSEGRAAADHIHFEALLIKRDSWKIMMEYQKSTATPEQWDALK